MKLTILLLVCFVAATAADKLYVTNYDGSVSICDIEASGYIQGPCAVTDGGGVLALHRPANLVIVGSYAYITLFDEYAGTEIAICPVLGDGSLGLCTLQDGFDQPNGIMVSPCNNKIFVANGGNNSYSFISGCWLDASSGTVSDCVFSDFPGVSGSNGIAAHWALKEVYFTNYYSPGYGYVDGYIYVCQVPEDGLTVQGCTVITHEFANPLDVHVDHYSRTLYVTNLGNNSFSACKLNAAGTALTACVDIFDTVDTPASVTVNVPKRKVYVAQNAGWISVCNLDDNDNISPCTTFTDPSFSTPNGVFIRRV